VRDVEGRGAPQQLELALTAPALARRLRVLAVVVELDTGATREQLKGGAKPQSLPGLHEREHVAAGIAAKAFEQLLARADIERRRALIVQRTAPGPTIRARAAQLGVLAGELNEIGRLADALLVLVAVAAHGQ